LAADWRGFLKTLEEEGLPGHLSESPWPQAKVGWGEGRRKAEGSAEGSRDPGRKPLGVAPPKPGLGGTGLCEDREKVRVSGLHSIILKSIC
jgi:hypothetical protein